MDNSKMNSVNGYSRAIENSVQNIQNCLGHINRNAAEINTQKNALHLSILTLLSGIYRDEEGAHLGWKPERLAEWEREVREHLGLGYGNPHE